MIYLGGAQATFPCNKFTCYIRILSMQSTGLLCVTMLAEALILLWWIHGRCVCLSLSLDAIDISTFVISEAITIHHSTRASVFFFFPLVLIIGYVCIAF